MEQLKRSSFCSDVLEERDSDWIQLSVSGVLFIYSSFTVCLLTIDGNSNRTMSGDELKRLIPS